MLGFLLLIGVDYKIGFMVIYVEALIGIISTIINLQPKKLKLRETNRALYASKFYFENIRTGDYFFSLGD